MRAEAKGGTFFRVRRSRADSFCLRKVSDNQKKERKSGTNHTVGLNFSSVFDFLSLSRLSQISPGRELVVLRKSGLRFLLSRLLGVKSPMLSCSGVQ